jgi:hypothetical protein
MHEDEKTTPRVRPARAPEGTSFFVAAVVAVLFFLALI